MKRLIITPILLFTALLPGFAQKPQPAEAKNLSIDFEMLDSSSQNKEKGISILSIKNNGKVALPASGWSICFNSRTFRITGPDTLVASINRVNGDLFRLSPLKGFKSLQPGATWKIRLKSGEFTNYTELPGGFYLVWNNTPTKGHNIKQLTFKTNEEQLVAEKTLAANIYHQNKLIKDIPESQLPQVFPTPAVYVKNEGAFKLRADVKIGSEGDVFEKEIRKFSEELLQIFNKKVETQKTDVNAKQDQMIVFLQNPKLDAEGYELSVTPDRITISAAKPAGAFYAIQSLKIMFPAQAWAITPTEISIPAVDIKDSPRFGLRGFMMDVGRNFQSKKEVLKALDVMALYKLNVFHFHLTEDEGWRLEIPGLPELTAVGGKRDHTSNDPKQMLPSFGSGAIVDGNSGSGFYTRADYIEILKYAAERHIKVIPEIETPGHARAAIKSMDARYARLMKEGKKAEAEQYLLSDPQDQSKYRSVQGWDDNVINVALPSVYNFLGKVTDELIAMHKEAGNPLETIHFGGDEVPAGVWEKSPVASNLLKADPAIKGVDELWHYYFTKVNGILKSRGLYLSGWEEIGLRKAEVNGQKQMVLDQRFVNENFHADVWNNVYGNEDLGYKMANAGYKVVLTYVTNLYIDMAVNKSFGERGQNWGGYVDIDKPFYFIPYNYYKNVKEDDQGNPVNPAMFNEKVHLTPEGKKNIVGLQSPLWSETLKTVEQFEYMLLPKLLSTAERAWAKDPEWALETDATKEKALYNQAWSEFVNVLGKKELPRLSHYSGGYLYRIPTPGVILKDGNLEANMQLPGFTIHYTLDGSTPEKTSAIYKGAIPAKGKVMLRAFDGTGRGGRAILIQ